MIADTWLAAALGAAGLLLCLIALLSSMETALRNARRSRLTGFSEARAARVEALIESQQQFLASAHLGKSLAESLLYACAALAGLEIAVMMRGETVPQSLGGLLAIAWPGVMAGALTAYFCVTLLGEALPKTLACRHPERTVVRWHAFITGFTFLFAPVWFITRRLGIVLARGSGADAAGAARAAHSEEEIKLLVEGSAEEGVLEEEEKEMIHSIIEFTDTVARQVMAPRIDVDSVSADTTIEEAVEQILKTGHSRLPVYEGTLDHVVGVVHVKDLLGLYRGGESISVRSVMRDPYFIPEGKKLDELLQEFRRQKSQMAIVVDEFGGTSGLVTVEDVLEEIVGEMEDEYDQAEPTPALLTDEAGAAIVDARMTIQDVNELLELNLPSDDFDTLGGFVFSLFGRPPLAGEQVSWENLHFLVESLDGLRLQKIRLVREEAAPVGVEEA